MNSVALAQYCADVEKDLSTCRKGSKYAQQEGSYSSSKVINVRTVFIQ